MDRETWIDAFNLLRRWGRTKTLFADANLPGFDIGRAVETGLNMLADALGKQARRARVFLDGGQQRGTRKLHGMRVFSPGAGAKADDAILERLDALGQKARQVSLVTSDRALAAAARGRGAQIVTVESFVCGFDSKRPTARAPHPDKHRQLDRSEVEAWMRIFNQDSDPD